MSVTVLIPAWNEARRIGATITATRSIPGVEQVLVIDDGSTDNTADLSRQAGAEVVRLSENGGKGHALQVGIPYCKAEVLLFLDADLQESARQADVLLKPILQGKADMTIARFTSTKPAGFGLVRGLARWGIRRLAGMVTESPLSGQRAIRLAVFDRVKLAQGWGIEVALTIDAIRNGFRVVEVPVNLQHRTTGRDLSGFVHRGKQFAGVLQALLVRLLRGQKVCS